MSITSETKNSPEDKSISPMPLRNQYALCHSCECSDLSICLWSQIGSHHHHNLKTWVNPKNGQSSNPTVCLFSSNHNPL